MRERCFRTLMLQNLRVVLTSTEGITIMERKLRRGVGPQFAILTSRIQQVEIISQHDVENNFRGQRTIELTTGSSNKRYSTLALSRRVL